MTPVTELWLDYDMTTKRIPTANNLYVRLVGNAARGPLLIEDGSSPIDATEVLMEHFSPTEDVCADLGITARSTEWFTARWEGACAATSGRHLICADVADDQFVMVALTLNGCIVEELRFAAPDGEVSPLTAATIAAVAGVWFRSL